MSSTGDCKSADTTLVPRRASTAADAGQIGCTLRTGAIDRLERLADPGMQWRAFVTAGPGDTVHWTFRTDIDPGPNALVFMLPHASSYGGTSAVFDGYRITGLRHDIQAVMLQPPYAGPLTITPALGNGPRFVTVNLNGVYGANESFTLQVTFVPEPGSAALLLAGLGVLVVAARRGATRRGGSVGMPAA